MSHFTVVGILRPTYSGPMRGVEGAIASISAGRWSPFIWSRSKAGIMLTDKQLIAVAALAAGATQAEAARQAGVSAVTVCKWLKNNDEFRRAAEKVNGSIVKTLCDRINPLVPRAIKTLEALLTHTNAYVRARAVRMTLDYSIRGLELSSQQDKLAELEAQLESLKHDINTGADTPPPSGPGQDLSGPAASPDGGPIVDQCGDAPRSMAG